MTWTALDGTVHHDGETHHHADRNWTHIETSGRHVMIPRQDPHIRVEVDKRNGKMTGYTEGRTVSHEPDEVLASNYKVMATSQTKRDFDPGVGGGVDRDKLPAADFAGPNRTYPIVTPKDVADAAALVGKHPEVKPKIIEIAKRKGPAFVAELPEAWKAKKDWSAWDAQRGSSGAHDPAPMPHGNTPYAAQTNSQRADTLAAHSQRISSRSPEAAMHLANASELVRGGDHESALGSLVQAGDAAHDDKAGQGHERAIGGYVNAETDSHLRGSKNYGGTMQTKAWVNLAGSFEATQGLVSDAIDRWMDQMFPGQMTYSWLEATFPNYVIVGVGATTDGDFDADNAHCEYWKVPYTVDDDSSVTLGEPKSIDIRGVAVDKPGDDSDEMDFLPAANVIAKSLAFKNASHLRRHYALLAYNGVDITGSGLTPAILATAPSGTATIPSESDASYLTGQSDLSQPGTVSDVPDNNSVPSQGHYLDNAGNLTAPEIPSWYQGTYYLDNAGNLVPSPVPTDASGYYNSDNLSNMSAPPVAAQGSYLDNVGNMPAVAVNAVGTSTDAGTLTLAGVPRGQTKGRSLLKMLKAQRYRVPGVPVAEPGVKTGLSEGTAKLMAVWPEVQAKVTELSIAVKEGRVLSGSNLDRALVAHSALTDLLQKAGVFDAADPTSAADGDDEDGNKIPVSEAKGLTLDEVMAWKRQRAEVLGSDTK